MIDSPPTSDFDVPALTLPLKPAQDWDTSIAFTKRESISQFDPDKLRRLNTGVNFNDDAKSPHYESAARTSDVELRKGSRYDSPSARDVYRRVELAPRDPFFLAPPAQTQGGESISIYFSF